MNKIKHYLLVAKNEILKVIFPTKEQIRSAFISVLIVVAIIALFLALIDIVMSYSLSNIIN